MESDAVERATRGVAPRFLGKDEVASSNLASSSKKRPTPSGVGLFLVDARFEDQMQHPGGVLRETSSKTGRPQYFNKSG